MELKETIEPMQSSDYKERFKAEYYQLKVRKEKLEKMLEKWMNAELDFKPTCPMSTYHLQIHAMVEYMAVLEARAKMEEIEL